MKTNELKLQFLYGTESIEATPTQLEEFNNLGLDYSKIAKHQRIKTSSIHATFEHYNNRRNTVYLRKL